MDLSNLSLTMDTLAVELLTATFTFLGYVDLTSVMATSRRWRAVVLNDIRLCQALFLRQTAQYFPDEKEVVQSSTALRAHPVFSSIRYRFGDDLENVGFIGRDTHIHPIGELDVFNNFAFIPSINKLQVRIYTDHGYKATCPVLKISVSNPCGITVKDVISGLAHETARKVDLISYVCGGAFSQRLHGGQRPALTMLANVLPQQRRCFSNFINLHRHENLSTVEIQPST